MPWKADDTIDGIYSKHFKFADNLERCRTGENEVEVEADTNLLWSNLSRMLRWPHGWQVLL